MVIQQFVTSVESFPYLAVPFFIMVGSVMNYSGISEELMNMAEVLAGHMKGGLAQVNCLLSAMMEMCIRDSHLCLLLENMQKMIWQ